MLYITGDTHGEISRLYEFNKILNPGDYIIVTGDFGYIFKDDSNEHVILDDIQTMKWNLCFIDGNHENFDALNKYPEIVWNGGRVHKIRNNIFHLMRGQVFEICGKKIYAFGGGYSIDKHLRKEGLSWWSQEMPTDIEMSEGNKNLAKEDFKVDYIISHAVPLEILESLGITHGTKEYPLNNYLQYLVENIKYDKFYCGHMHMDKDFSHNISVLWFDIKKL